MGEKRSPVFLSIFRRALTGFTRDGGAAGGGATGGGAAGGHVPLQPTHGRAAWPLRQTIDLVHKQVVEHADWHATIWAKPTSPWLRDEVLAQCIRYFDEAEAAVKDEPVLAQRVAVARLPVRYTQNAKAKPGDPEAAAWLKTFETVARKAGLTMVREHGGTGRLDVWLAAQRKRLKIGVGQAGR